MGTVCTANVYAILQTCPNVEVIGKLLAIAINVLVFDDGTSWCFRETREQVAKKKKDEVLLKKLLVRIASIANKRSCASVAIAVIYNSDCP